ncbi:unnamed protein product, partial [marine sediment metagenome]
MLDFLKNLITKIDYLFVLGDTFEFWYNDRKALLKEYSEILEIFKELSLSGTKLLFFEGNHDICYGSFFENELKADIYRKCTTLKINQFTVFLGHGDELIKNNIKYIFWRSLLRLPPVKLIISTAPSGVVLKIALMLSRLSHKIGNIKKTGLNNAYRELALQKFKEGIDVVILGHTHVPESFRSGKGLYINCGNWLEDFSFV